METNQIKGRNPIKIFAIQVAHFHWILLGLGLLARILVMLYASQLRTENYWEYGIIANNILDGKGYSFNFTDQHLNFLNETYPSALMPPGYVFFILPFLLIKDIVFRNFLVFLIQIGLQILAIWFSYQMLLEKWGKLAALICLVLLCFLPDLIFACISIGPTVWFQFLLTMILWFYRKNGKTSWLVLGLLAGILILMRSESIIIVAAIAVLHFKRSGLKFTFLFGSVVLLFLFPWVYRNFKVLGIGRISNNVGINFYRGNNAGEIGDWPQGFDKTYYLLRSNPETFEVKYDKYAFDRSITYIKSNPERWIWTLPEKLFRFVVIDWPDVRTHQVLYWFPWFICLIFGFIGIKLGGTILKEELIILLLFTTVMVVFFPQIRYQTMIKFFFLPFSGIGLAHFFNYSNEMLKSKEI